MKLTLSLENPAAGVQSSGGSLPVTPELAALFAALLCGCVDTDKPDGSGADDGAADGRGQDAAQVPGQVGDAGATADPALSNLMIAGLTGVILPPGGKVLPDMPVQSGGQTASNGTQAAGDGTAAITLTLRGVRADRMSQGERVAMAELPPTLAPGLDWARALAIHSPGDAHAPGLLAIAPDPSAAAPGQSIGSFASRDPVPTDAVPSDAAIAMASRLARLRGDPRGGQGETAPVTSPASASMAAAAALDPVAGDSRKPALRLPSSGEFSTMPDQPVRPVPQPLALPADPGANPIGDVPSFHAPRADLARQIDRAVEALGAAPGEGIDRAARLTIPHDRHGQMALHLAREDDGAIGLNASGMPQDVRQTLADGLAEAERRLAAPPSAAHHAGNLGDHTQGRGSNGEPRSPLDERSGGGRDAASARQDRSTGDGRPNDRMPGDRPQKRRQPPQDHGVFA